MPFVNQHFLFSVLNSRALGLLEHHSFDLKRIPSALELEFLLLSAPTTVKRYEYQSISLALRIVRLLADSTWTSELLEHVLLLEYEFIESEADRLTVWQGLPSKERVRWSRQYKSMYENHAELRARIESARKLPSPHSIIISQLEELIIFTKSKEMIPPHLEKEKA